MLIVLSLQIVSRLERCVCRLEQFIYANVAINVTDMQTSFRRRHDSRPVSHRASVASSADDKEKTVGCVVWSAATPPDSSWVSLYF